MQGCALENPHTRKTPLPRRTPQGILLLYAKTVLIDLNYKKFLFTAVKRNLLTLKRIDK